MSWNLFPAAPHSDCLEEGERGTFQQVVLPVLPTQEILS